MRIHRILITQSVPLMGCTIDIGQNPAPESAKRPSMLIRLGYDLQFELPAPVSFVAMLHVHPSRSADLREPDLLQVDPALSLDSYVDSFGNICTRFDAPTPSDQLDPRVAPLGALLESPSAKPPITHTATRFSGVEAAGMAKLPPTEAHGGTQPTHWPPASSALPVVPRSLPSTNQPCEP